MLLGVNSPWEVKDVQLKLDDKKVEIELGWQWGADAICRSAAASVPFMIARRSGRGGIWTRCSSRRSFGLVCRGRTVRSTASRR